MIQKVTKVFHLIQTNPGAGEGPQLARNPHQGENEHSSDRAAGHPVEPSGRGAGHLVGTWRRLPDLSTRLTPIHLVRKETDWQAKIKFKI